MQTLNIFGCTLANKILAEAATVIKETNIHEQYVCNEHTDASNANQSENIICDTTEIQGLIIEHFDV